MNDWRESAVTWATAHVTRTGAIGGGVYVLARLGHAIYHRSIDELFDSLGYLGLFLVVAGAAFSSKKAAEEAKADRAQIAQAVGATTPETK